MRKLLSFLAVLIFSFSVSLSAQITNPASVVFLIKSFDSPNLVGDPLVTATAWFNPDTMENFTITVTVTDTTDSTHVDLGIILKRGERTITRKTLTDIRTDAELWLPDTVWTPGFPDSLFSMVLKDALFVPGERFSLEINNWRGPLSRLTLLIDADTLADNADTSYSPAFWGAWRWDTFAFEGITSSTSDNDNHLGWGYQNKFGGEWSKIYVITDSLLLEQSVIFDTTLGIVDIGVADSSRIAAWGVATTTNLYWWLRWIGRSKD